MSRYPEHFSSLSHFTYVFAGSLHSFIQFLCATVPLRSLLLFYVYVSRVQSVIKTFCWLLVDSSLIGVGVSCWPRSKHIEGWVCQQIWRQDSEWHLLSSSAPAQGSHEAVQSAGVSARVSALSLVCEPLTENPQCTYKLWQFSVSVLLLGLSFE